MDHFSKILYQATVTFMHFVLYIFSQAFLMNIFDEETMVGLFGYVAAQNKNWSYLYFG